MRKTRTALLLAAACLFALSAPAYAAALTDLPETKWYCREVREMVDQGYITGYPDGSFRGEEAMSLAEFTTLLARITGVPCGAQDGHWAGMQLAAARSLQWLDARDLERTGYDVPIPRQLAAKLLVQALDLALPADATEDLPFGDLSDISGDYLPYAAVAYAHGLFRGDNNGNFSPTGDVSRGAAATLIYRAIHLGDESNGDEDGIPHPGYTAEQVKAHFRTCALSAEYGDNTAVVKKWAEPIYYTYSGTPGDGDAALLEAFMAELNGIQGFPGIYPAGSRQANLTIHFVPDTAAMYACTGMTGLDGYAYISWYTSGYQIHTGDVYYLGSMADEIRAGVLIEELFQSLGILNDTEDYPESILYQYYTDASWPCALDWAILRALYHPDMQRGMNAQQSLEVLDRILN